MENDILKHRKAVQENILKSFGAEVSEDMLEKAHNHGEVHLNGKWYWESSANGGKGDWRTIKGASKSAPATNSAKPQPKAEEEKEDNKDSDKKKEYPNNLSKEDKIKYDKIIKHKGTLYIVEDDGIDGANMYSSTSEKAIDTLKNKRTFSGKILVFDNKKSAEDINDSIQYVSDQYSGDYLTGSEREREQRRIKDAFERLEKVRKNNEKSLLYQRKDNVKK